MLVSLFLFFVILILIDEYFKNRRIRIIIIFLFSMLLMFNRGNKDFNTYIILFDNPDGLEPGYKLLVNFVSRLGGNHVDIVLLVGVLLILTLFRLSRKTNHISLILFLYLVFPYIYDITQIRNTIMLLLNLNALIEFNDKHIVKAFMLSIIAITFHISGILLLIVLIMLFNKKSKKYYKHVIILSVLIVVILPIFVFAIKSLPINQELLYKIKIYTPDKIKYSSAIIWGGILILDLIVFNFFSKNTIKFNVKNNNYIKNLYDYLFTTLIFIGLTMNFHEFSRIYRSMFVFKYILVSLLIDGLNVKNKTLLILYIFITTIIFAVAYSYGAEVDYSLDFFNNLIFNGF